MTQPTHGPQPNPPLSPSTSASPPPSPRQAMVTGVVWQNVLEFAHLFRGFRLAINPAKLGVALLAILLIYTAGRIFDGVWGPQVYSDELQRFATDKPEAYQALRASREELRVSELERMLERAHAYDDSLTDARIGQLKGEPEAAFRALKAAYTSRFMQQVADAHNARLAGEKLGDAKAGAVEREERARAAAGLLASVQQARQTAGRGIFDAFLQYEMSQFDLLVDNTLSLVRVAPAHDAGDSGGAEGAAVSGGLVSRNPDRLWRSDTLAGCLANMTITAPEWLFSGTAPLQWRPSDAASWGGWFKMQAYRVLYLAALLVLAGFSLIVLAFAGGSIARLSALELGGAERPPLKDVFSFTARRLWVFIKTPIMPLLILFLIGLALTAGGLIGAIPFVGEILLGLFFIIFLAIGFVLMLLALGIIGGFNLLYPTIAVEGADAFDAMSRSFAYAYARPWRLLWLTLVSLVYGVVTFLFVSFAVYLILAITHLFAGWGAGFFGLEDGAYSGALKLDTLWPVPHFGSLIAPINWYAMSWSEYLGALCLHFWVFLLIAGIGAYVISYYFSSHTIMYLLLRRSVDGQAIREVYQDEARPEASAPSAPPPAAEPAAPPPTPSA